MMHCSPPRFACRVLELFLPTLNRDAIMGDLIEEYAVRLESTSAPAASRWFWGQACRSVPCLLWSSLWSTSCLITGGIAVGVYIFMAIMKLFVDLAIARLLAPGQTTRIVLAPVVFLAAAAIGGCIAARVRRGATVFLAFIVMITVIVLIEVRICTVPVPWWYPFGFLTLGPAVVLITPAVFSLFSRPVTPGPERQP